MLEDENDTICFVCEKTEVNPLLTIECANCYKSVHFRCMKLFGNAVAKARKKPFICSVECTQTNGQSPVILSELRSLGQTIKETQKEEIEVRKALEQTRMQLDTLMKSSKCIEDSQQFLSNQFEELRVKFFEFSKEMNMLKNENSKTKDELKDLQHKYNALLLTVDSMETQMNKVNQAAVVKNVIILGLPLIDGEDTKGLVCQIGTAVGIEFTPNVIVNAQRLRSANGQKSSVPLLVSFYDQQTKEKLLEHKRRYGTLLASTVSRTFEGSSNRVIVRDEMTSATRNLLREAKDMQAELNMKYIWPGRGGKVLLRRCDGGKVDEIGSKLQLLRLAEMVSQEKVTR